MLAKVASEGKEGGAEGENKEGDSKEEGEVVTGTVEWPELDAAATVVGHLRGGTSLSVYVSELTSGPPDTLAFLLSLKFSGEVEENEVKGEWDGVASAIPPPPVKVCAPFVLLVFSCGFF